MDEHVDIELNEMKKEAPDAVQLPVNFLSFGEIENDDVKVYIRQDVYKALEKYALEDTKHERGTILLGEYREDLGKTHVVITDYIEARYTDASAATLTFTHETWDYVHKEQDEKYPGKRIVGWQHTHPSYGIFLSNYDLFIQENFFNLPFQIAYVIDPVQNLRGFFQWKNGKIEKLKGYYIYDDIGKTIKLPQEKKAAGEKGGKRGFSLAAVLITLIAVVLAAVSLFLISGLKKQLEIQEERQQAMVGVILEQEQELSAMKDQIAQAESKEPNEDVMPAVSELETKLESQQKTIDYQQQVIDELQKTLKKEQQDTEPPEEYIHCTAKEGDTLEKICASLQIDYWRNRELILGLNQIEDENVILAGQELIFPKKLTEKK